MKTDMSQGAILLEGVISRKCHQDSFPDDLVEEMESPQPFSVKKRRDSLCLWEASGETPPVKYWAFG